MYTANATIQNAAGIHCRPSAILVKEGSAYEGSIHIRAQSGTCDLTSALDLIMLGLEPGAKVTIEVSGPDEEAFCLKLAALFEHHFDFPPL